MMAPTLALLGRAKGSLPRLTHRCRIVPRFVGLAAADDGHTRCVEHLAALFHTLYCCVSSAISWR